MYTREKESSELEVEEKGSKESHNKVMKIIIHQPPPSQKRETDDDLVVSETNDTTALS